MSAELAQRMDTAAPNDRATATGAAAAAWGAAAAAAAAGAGSGAAAGVPLPVWMRDGAFLNPLLSAYDERVRSLEHQLAAKAAAVRAIEQQVRLRLSPASAGRRGLLKKGSTLNPRGITRGRWRCSVTD